MVFWSFSGQKLSAQLCYRVCECISDQMKFSLKNLGRSIGLCREIIFKTDTRIVLT